MQDSIVQADTQYIDSLQQEISHINPEVAFTHIGKLLLTLAALVVVFWLLNFLFRKAKEYIMRIAGTKFKPVKIRNYELLNTNREAGIIVMGISLLRYMLMVVALIIAVPIIFSIFPQTKDVAQTLFAYIFTPVRSIVSSIARYIPNLFTIVIIWLFIHYLVRGVRFFTREIEAGRLKIPGFYSDWAVPTFHIIRVLLYAFMVAMIYPYLPGSGSGIFQGISVFLGIILSLGSTAVVGNVLAGMVITYMRPFKIGDWIKLNDVMGKVIEKTAFVTRIRTHKNEIITIPNSFMMSLQTVNYTASASDYGLIIHISVGIDYAVPNQQVRELLIRAAKMTDGVQQDREPFVNELKFKDSYLEYEINAYINNMENYIRVQSDLHANVQALCDEAGINLQTAYLLRKEDKSEMKTDKN